MTSGPVVAIIPARGGSKGIPRKNLQTVGGLPLVTHAIRAALNARTVDHVIVSTEDAEIAEVSRAAGARVIERPHELASDTAKGEMVLKQVLATLGDDGLVPEVVVLLQPTSPLRQADDIDGAVKLLWEKNAESVFSITEVDHHPAKYVRLTSAGLAPFGTEHEMEARRDQLEPLYRQNGAVYVVRAKAFLEAGQLFCRPCAGYLMDRESSVDIDEPLDLQLAELLFAANAKRQAQP